MATMEQLYAPWRTTYITKTRSKKACVFCKEADTTHDAEHFILKRGEHCFVMLNIYPYNAGHLMVIPYHHAAQLSALSIEAQHELIELTSESMDILKKVLKAQGFNAGLNLGGKAAGGSIARHLHMHVVPRWKGDTNFMATIAEVKPISADLVAIYRKLLRHF